MFCSNFLINHFSTYNITSLHSSPAFPFLLERHHFFPLSVTDPLFLGRHSITGCIYPSWPIWDFRVGPLASGRSWPSSLEAVRGICPRRFKGLRAYSRSSSPHRMKSTGGGASQWSVQQAAAASQKSSSQSSDTLSPSITRTSSILHGSYLWGTSARVSHGICKNNWLRCSSQRSELPQVWACFYYSEVQNAFVM